MKIETKFEIGEEAWLIWNNRVISTVIEGFFYDSAFPEVKYDLKDIQLHGEEDSIRESQLFKSKKELLMSL